MREEFTDEQIAAAERDVADERAKVVAYIDELTQRDKEAVKRAERASARYHKLADKDKTMTYSVKDGGTTKPTKLGVAHRELQVAMASVGNLGDALAAQRSRLAKIDDPAEVERRARLNLAKGRPTGEQPRRNVVADMKQVPQKIIDKIIKGIEAGHGAGHIGTDLNKEGLKDPAGNPWNFRRVRDAIEAATGKNWFDLKKEHRKKPVTAARASSGARKSSSAKKTTSRKGSASKKTTGGSRKKGSVTPLSKEAQASGTSRGGTGSRKKATTQSARSRGSARKSGRAVKRAPVKRTWRKRK